MSKSALPILLLGGAVLLVMGKKKRNPGAKVSGGFGPVAGSNKPIREEPQNPERGYPFESTREVQEALTYKGYNPGEVDGKWGKKTTAALNQFKKKEAKGKSKQVTLQKLSTGAAKKKVKIDGCDPLLQDCPEGQMCFDSRGHFVCLPVWQDTDGALRKETDAAVKVTNSSPAGYEFGPGGFREIAVSPDFKKVKIGGGFMIGKLDPYLRRQVKAGKLTTFNHWSQTLERIFWSDPNNFWVSALENTFGKGSRIDFGYMQQKYGKRGKAYNLNEFLDDNWEAMKGVVKQDPVLGVAMPFTGLASVLTFHEAIAAGVFAGTVGGGVLAGLALATVFVFTAAATSNILGINHRNSLIETATWAWGDFLDTYYARWGDKIIKLSDIPMNSPAADKIFTDVMRYIVRFQKMEVE